MLVLEKIAKPAVLDALADTQCSVCALHQDLDGSDAELGSKAGGASLAFLGGAPSPWPPWAKRAPLRHSRRNTRPQLPGAQRFQVQPRPEDGPASVRPLLQRQPQIRGRHL
eukprot:2015641-Pyramimonas_sp.AAC.1